MLGGDEGVKIKSTRVSPNLNLDNTPLLTWVPLLRLCKSNVKHAYFMYITSTCNHLDQWKSFMKFGIKRSHKMISYIFVRIVMLSEWKHWSLNEPCNLAQMTLEELYNQSYEKFMLSKWPENASIDQKG